MDTPTPAPTPVFRLIYDRHPRLGYSIERFHDGAWHYMSGSLSFTKWGARFWLWRHRRDGAAKKPAFDVLQEWLS